MINRRWRGAVATIAAAGLALSAPATVQASGLDGREIGPAAEQKTMLLVHGYNPDPPTNCNGSTWDAALEYYQEAGGRDRSSMRTIGYYEGDRAFCDDVIGDGQADRERPIQEIAKDFANYIYAEYTSKGEEVDIVAHSMGGLITRVAVLGTREGWSGFPPRVAVEDIVTLGTPHQGLINGCRNPDADPDDKCTRQWNQMTPAGEGGSGFIDKLHESAPGRNDRGLDDPWAAGIDWSLVSSLEDETVSYYSGIDKGYFAHQKYGYDEDLNDNGVDECSDPNVSHANLRQLTGAGGYCLRYWHHGADGGPHTTENGWSPLKVAFKAATYKGDDLPR
ncbi:esterase/lipase family protein [Saccharopolyspora hattusasensis]|uniref:esterase/lipase family protein n=1 Tax=Saccharopolyspora hattusasensis TaxID=1128679 RepID=UPI003D97326F